MESLSKFFAKSITIFGAIAGSAFAWLASQPNALFFWSGLAIIGFSAAAVGGVGWYNAHRRLVKDYRQRLEQHLITAAKHRKGRVTDVELVADTRYPLEECRAFLKTMTESGSAEMQIGKEGAVVYLFPGFLSDAEKREAQSPTEWDPTNRVAPSRPEGAPPPLEDEATPSRRLEAE